MANQDSSTILSFAIDQKTGALAKRHQVACPTPVCLLTFEQKGDAAFPPPSTADPTTESKLYGIALYFFFFACRERGEAGARHRPAVIKTLEALVVGMRDQPEEIVLDRPDCRDLRRVAHHT